MVSFLDLSFRFWTFSSIVVLFVTHLSYHPSDVKVKISYLKDSRSDDRAVVFGVIPIRNSVMKKNKIYSPFNSFGIKVEKDTMGQKKLVNEFF